MQLLTFGSRELKPNDQLHVNWKLAQARAAALALFRFSQVLSPTPKKKFNFKKQGGVFLWLTNIDLGHQRYFFPFLYTKWVPVTLLSNNSSLCGPAQKVKIWFPSTASVKNPSGNSIYTQRDSSESKYWLSQHTRIRYINQGPNQWGERLKVH